MLEDTNERMRQPWLIGKGYEFRLKFPAGKLAGKQKS